MNCPCGKLTCALFIQDDFRVRPNVTVSMGLRYERFGQPINGILKLNPSCRTHSPHERRRLWPALRHRLVSGGRPQDGLPWGLCLDV